MSDDYIFATAPGIPTHRVAAAVNRAVRPFGGRLNWAGSDEGRPRHWVSVDDRGAPFNYRAEIACIRALEEAGLYPIPVKRRWRSGWQVL